jgi:hypothetical protein
MRHCRMVLCKKQFQDILLLEIAMCTKARLQEPENPT